jgi:hypothetical protein
MDTIKTNDDEMMALEMSYLELTRRFMEDKVSPYACAAVMAKLSMMIYKTSLSEEDYNLMIDTISNNRHAIKSLTEYTNGGRLN